VCERNSLLVRQRKGVSVQRGGVMRSNERERERERERKGGTERERARARERKCVRVCGARGDESTSTCVFRTSTCVFRKRDACFRIVFP